MPNMLPTWSSRLGHYVQYGCLFCAPASWLNFDASPTLRFERIPILGRLYTKNQVRFPDNVRYGDIVKGLPIPPTSCQGLYCSHVLEHLSLKDCRTALVHSYTYLSPAGVFRMVLPDLEQLARSYLLDITSEASYRFMKESSLGCEERPRGLEGFLCSWLGNSRHLWMWDYRSLERELATVGFKKIRRALFGDAGDCRFRDVEEAHRFKGCLAIECIR